MNKTYPFKLQPLPYDYNALEPFIDQETMHYHHDKHHQAYVNNLNAALAAYPNLHDKTLVELLRNTDQLPDDIRTKVINNAGGVLNHNLFFEGMTPNSNDIPIGKLALAIDQGFGSFENFKATFKKAALERFGSGWAWLVSDDNGDLKIISTANQDVPLSLTVKPILEIDVWEHAYYLNYQNRRADYIDNWFKVIDWDKAENNYLNPFL